MTEFFSYANLTFPEIAHLPRDTPLVIPLGEGFCLTNLASALGEPRITGLLPAIPYSWAGSGLHLPETLLSALVGNLLDSLREDGFSRVYALTPQEIDLRLSAARITLFHPSQTAEPTYLPEDPHRAKVIVIPVGHTEQHAYHLPMSTDSLIIEAIGNGLAAVIPEQAFSLPIFPYGLSTHLGY